MVEVEDCLSEAFVKRTRHANKFNVEPRLMALTTIMVSDLTLTSWFLGESKDCATAAKNVFGKLTRLFWPKTTPHLFQSPRNLANRSSVCAD